MYIKTKKKVSKSWQSMPDWSVIVDANYIILTVVLKWLNSTHNSKKFSESDLINLTVHLGCHLVINDIPKGDSWQIAGDHLNY